MQVTKTGTIRKLAVMIDREREKPGGRRKGTRLQQTDGGGSTDDTRYKERGDQVIPDTKVGETT